MLPLDTSLFTSEAAYIWLGTFAVLGILISLEVSSGRTYVGSLVAAGTAAAACIFIPSSIARTGLLAATAIIIVIGRMDEVHKLSAGKQLFWQCVVASLLVVSGWTIPFVTHPFQEGLLYLDMLQFGPLSLPADLLAVAWIVLLMNAVNWLDGMDGLAGGVGIIAHIALAAVAMLPSIQSATTLGLAGIGASALVAFFIWNAPPAKVYLGTIGSWFVGMFLALTSSGGGGKIATATLLLAVPLVDVAIVIIRRYLAGRPLWVGDTINHLHHRLLRAGVSQKSILGAALVVTAWFAVMGIILETSAKLYILGAGGLGVAVAALALWRQRRTMNRYYEHSSAIYRR